MNIDGFVAQIEDNFTNEIHLHSNRAHMCEEKKNSSVTISMDHKVFVN